MQKGWNKEDLRAIIARLNHVDPFMKIDVYRTQKVSDMFGVIEKDVQLSSTEQIYKRL